MRIGPGSGQFHAGFPKVLRHCGCMVSGHTTHRTHRTHSLLHRGTLPFSYLRGMLVQRLKGKKDDPRLSCRARPFSKPFKVTPGLHDRRCFYKQKRQVFGSALQTRRTCSETKSFSVIRYQMFSNRALP
jgi:hypothetical protein